MPLLRRFPLNACEDHFRVISGYINADGVHRWPFPPSFPIDVRLLKNGRNPNVRMNRHDYFEVFYILSGSANLRIADRLLALTTGDLGVVGSTVYHTVEAHPGSRFTYAVLFFMPDLIRTDGGADGNYYLTPFLLQDDQFPHVIPAKTGIPADVLHLMQSIFAELPADTPLARLAVKTYLKLVLLRLVQRYAHYAGTAETFERRQKALARIQPLFDYVEAHFNSPIRLERAAHICRMSKSHFMNFFKEATGQSFLSYLNHYRVERALNLLRVNDTTLAEIAQEVGFCDQSYFGMVFRRLVGMTPSAYRQQVRTDGAVQSDPSHPILTLCPPPNPTGTGNSAHPLIS